MQILHTELTKELLYLLPIVITVLAYRISLKTYNKSLPYISLKHFQSVSGLDNASKLGSYQFTYLNSGTPIYWGIVYLKDRHTNIVYSSKPFMNLKTNQKIDVNLLYGINSEGSKLRKKLQKLTFYGWKKISLKKKTNRTYVPDDERFRFYMYFKDYEGNTFTFSQNKAPHNLDFPPKSQSLLHWWNIFEKINISILRRKSIKTKYNYSNIIDTLIEAYPPTKEERNNADAIITKKRLEKQKETKKNTIYTDDSYFSFLNDKYTNVLHE